MTFVGQRQLLVVCLGISVCAPSLDAAAIASVRDVNVESGPGRTLITIRLSGPASYKLAQLTGPDRVFVDFPSVDAGPLRDAATYSGPLVQRIRTGHPEKGVTRLVIDLTEPVSYSVAQPDPLQLTVALEPAPAPVANPAVPVPPPALVPVIPDPPSPLLRLTLPAPPPEPVPVGPATFEIRVQEVSQAAPPPQRPFEAAELPTPVAQSSRPSSPAIPRSAPAPAARTLTISRAATPPRFESYLHGVPADAGAPVTGFVQRDPGDGVAPSQPTTAYLSYDDQNLYVVFVCKDDPLKIRAHAAKREDIGNDDQVLVYLDTFQDRQHAYVFASNPLGTQADGLYTESQSNTDYSFDTLWRTEGRVTSDGYVVLMSIPFKSVRFANSRDQTWGIELQRVIARNNEGDFWPYVTRKTAGLLQQAAQISGFEGVSAGRVLQMIPYGAFTYDRSLDPAAPRLITQNQGRAGMDTKAALSNSVTLDVTLNPDFSQVESDDPQVTVNQRYEVYFPEKRPFFLENASYFQTPINLFFSRRIVDPEFGARLTGKVGPWAIGVLGSDDRAPGQQFGSSGPAEGARSADGLFSLRREFGNQSSIGLLATSEDFGSSSNRVYSLDTRLRLSSTWFLTAQAALDYDRQPGGLWTQGKAYFADLNRSGRNFTYDSQYSDFSPDFKAPLGYVKRVDLRRVDQYIGYLWRPEAGPVVDFGPFVDGSMDWDHRGLSQDWNGSAGFNVDFRGASGFKVSRSESFERYLGAPFRYSKNLASFYASRGRWLLLYGGISQGAGINYDPAGNLQPFLGNTSDDYFGVTIRPTPRVRWDELYYYDRLAPPGGPVAYTNHLIRTKLNYQFTKELSLRAIVDYYSVLPNAALINQIPLKQLTGDILLTYMLNPGTAIYIGYNNRRENLGFDPENPGTLNRFGPPSYLTNSQIFIKLSYLLRY